jgi:hypothetical protein
MINPRGSALRFAARFNTFFTAQDSRGRITYDTARRRA